MPPGARRMVFIAGLHRSGTSLLHSLFGAHPSVSAFENTGVPEDEGQHLQSVYPTARVFGGPGRFGFHPGAYMDECHELARTESRDRLLGEWSRHWRSEAPVWVEKSPPNLIRTRFLQALFPDATFVVLLRHPIAVACATQKWVEGEPLERLLEHWAICHEAFSADRAHLRRVLTLRYEELVGRPQEVMNRIWSFLNLEPIAIETELRQGINAAYFREWEQLRRRMLAGRRLRTAAKRLEPRVLPFGYSLLEPEWAADEGLAASTPDPAL